MGFLDSLKKYDPYVKSTAGASVQTVGGASVTLVCAVLVLYLVVKEFIFHREVARVGHLEIDLSVGTTQIPVHLDVDFLTLDCGDIELVLDNTEKSLVDLTKQVTRTPASSGKGCKVKGVVHVPKVAGVLHVAMARNGKNGNGISMSEFQKFDASHRINVLSFGDPFPGIVNPLDGVEGRVESGVAQFQYHAKIVPTFYRPLHGDEIFTNQYSAAGFSKVVNPFDSFGFLSKMDIPGVYIKYEFSSLNMVKSESHQSVLHFATRICAIVGGLYTISGIVDQLLHSVVLSKKQD